MSASFQLLPLPRASTLRSDTTASLVRAVLRRELRHGDKLVVRKLATQLGISATPVREAIVELEAIGIVQVPPNQSAVILPFGPRELFEIYHLRGLFEAEATRLAAQRLPHEQLVKLRDEAVKLLHETRDVAEDSWTTHAIEHDQRLHRLISYYCGSGRLFHEIGRYAKLMQVIRETVGNKLGGLNKSLQDHQQIVQDLLDGDAERAAQKMSEHIEHAAIRDIRVLYGEKAAEDALAIPSIPEPASLANG